MCIRDRYNTNNIFLVGSNTYGYMSSTNSSLSHLSVAVRGHVSIELWFITVSDEWSQECPVLNQVTQRCREIAVMAGDMNEAFLPLCNIHQICYLDVYKRQVSSCLTFSSDPGESWAHNTCRSGTGQIFIGFSSLSKFTEPFNHCCSHHIPVSYTHLDVYKRQLVWSQCVWPP